MNTIELTPEQVKLIKAAPVLLESLTELLALNDGAMFTEHNPIEKAKAAIERARA